MIKKILIQELPRGMDGIISRAYALYIRLGEPTGYYEFRKQAKKDLKKISKMICKERQY